jgi:hypothetical protein
MRCDVGGAWFSKSNQYSIVVSPLQSIAQLDGTDFTNQLMLVALFAVVATHRPNPASHRAKRIMQSDMTNANSCKAVGLSRFGRH